MTDNEIIKALEICAAGSCTGCPANLNSANCLEKLTQNALDLINRQKADVETLENNLKFVRGTLTRALDENEQLKKRLDSHCNNCRMRDRKERDRAEAIKEFTERLKEKSMCMVEYDEDGWGCPTRVVKTSDIDNLVKEMVGEQE